MKKWRRMVSSLLAAALLLTAVPTVWAAEEERWIFRCGGRRLVCRRSGICPG